MLFGIVALLGAAIWFAAANSTLLLDSRLGRLWEDNLPKISIEEEKTVYCRMKADDFRFPLPPGATVLDLEIASGSFDSVEGHVRVRFPAKEGMSARECEYWLRERLHVGGQINVEDDRKTNNILIRFSYFGDR